MHRPTLTLICFTLHGQFHELACSLTPAQRAQLDSFAQDNPWFGPMGDLYLETIPAPVPLQGEPSAVAWLAGLRGEAGNRYESSDWSGATTLAHKIDTIASQQAGPCQEYTELSLTQNDQAHDLGRVFVEDKEEAAYLALLRDLLDAVPQSDGAESFAFCFGGAQHPGTPGQVAQLLCDMERYELADLIGCLQSLDPPKASLPRRAP